MRGPRPAVGQVGPAVMLSQSAHQGILLPVSTARDAVRRVFPPRRVLRRPVYQGASLCRGRGSKCPLLLRLPIQF